MLYHLIALPWIYKKPANGDLLVSVKEQLTRAQTLSFPSKICKFFSACTYASIQLCLFAKMFCTLIFGRERSCQISNFFSPELSRWFSQLTDFKDSSCVNCVDKMCLIFWEFSAPGLCPLCGAVGNGIKSACLRKSLNYGCSQVNGFFKMQEKDFGF